MAEWFPIVVIILLAAIAVGVYEISNQLRTVNRLLFKQIYPDADY